jgi:ubiquinone/menaquinone biosynthesis C-methylase UbiE
MTTATTTHTTTTLTSTQNDVDAFLDDMLDASAGVFKIFSMHLGHKLGYYQALADGLHITSTQLSQRTNTHERYTREWLEQQTVAGILTVLDETAPAKERKFALPPGPREALTDKDSLNYLAPLPQLLAGVVSPINQLVEAYRNGGGVPFAEYGLDTRQGQGAINRATFLQCLGQEWLPAMPDIHAKLADPSQSPRVADFGCGLGWSCIGLAKTYPNAQIHGYDADHTSIIEAKQNAIDQGVSDRVTFHCVDVSQINFDQPYDLVLCCETVHDMADPVGALQTAKRMIKPDGAVLIVDERVADQFTAKGNDIEWLMYGFSILHCLPVGMADGAEHHCGGTGTCMRPSTLKSYALDAGFNNVQILPVDNLFFRLYRLNP